MAAFFGDVFNYLFREFYYAKLAQLSMQYLKRGVRKGYYRAGRNGITTESVSIFARADNNWSIFRGYRAIGIFSSPRNTHLTLTTCVIKVIEPRRHLSLYNTAKSPGRVFISKVRANCSIFYSTAHSVHLTSNQH